jgi:ribosome biogenesis GTPase
MSIESLAELGWRPFFQQQLTLDEAETLVPARVVLVQRSGITADDGEQTREIPLGGRWYQLPPEARPTVGDWVLLDKAGTAVARVLERESVFKRLAAGDRVEVQLIAANVDTLFIVTSANEEFNESRLERYLAVALEVNVQPVIVITKADLADDTDPYAEAAKAVRAGLPVEVVDARAQDQLAGVRAWCTRGQTIALVGSSGVGKSTLVNTLSGATVQDTGAIRERDSSGRHTTSNRSLHRLPDGGLLLDVPGMRELKIGDLESGVSRMFDDIEAIARDCRFSDCEHETEPGCAIRTALAAGTLDERRLANYRKLRREQRHASESLVEKHRRARSFSRAVRARMELSHKKR